MRDLDFDPSDETLMLSSNGSLDVFVQKFDSEGALVWVRVFGGLETDYGQSLCVDQNDNIYITGEFMDEVDFDPGVEEHIVESNGTSDVYILKLTSDGIFDWVRTFGGSDWDTGYYIDCDSDDNLYITGNFRNTVDFDPGIFEYDVSSTGGSDIFIEKLDSNGDFVWVKTFGGYGDELSWSLNLDNFDNVYITGRFRNTVKFEPGSDLYVFTAEGYYTNGFVLKLGLDGAFKWAKEFSGPGNIAAETVVNDNNGSVFIGVDFYETIDVDPGPSENLIPTNGDQDFLIVKLDSLGEYIWSGQVGGSVWDRVRSIVVTEKVFMPTGQYHESIDFDPGSDTSILTPVAYGDIFVQKLTNDGQFVWAKSMGGYEGEGGQCITLDSELNIFVTGSFHANCDFDPNDQEYILTANELEAFVVKLEQTGLNTSISEFNLDNFSVFPNPSHERIKINLGNTYFAVVVRQYDLAGKLISTKSFNNVENVNFELKDKAGPYLIEISADNRRGVVKILKN